MHPAFVGKQSEQLCRSPDQKLVQRALQKWRNAFAARKNVSPMCPAKCASRERSVCGQRDTACMPTSKSDVEVCGTTNREILAIPSISCSKFAIRQDCTNKSRRLWISRSRQQLVGDCEPAGDRGDQASTPGIKTVAHSVSKHSTNSPTAGPSAL